MAAVTLNSKSLLSQSRLLSVITNLTELRGPPQLTDLFCFGKQDSRERVHLPPELCGM